MNKKQTADTRPVLIYEQSNPRGWGPIGHMAQLATRILDLRLVSLELKRASKTMKAYYSVASPPRRHGPGVIAIIQSPAGIDALFEVPEFTRPQKYRAVWIIDSFWTERTPKARLLRHFDLVAYTQKGEAAFYESLAPGRTLWLGWGSDALDLGSSSGDRPIDILRVGRQPEDWDDDVRTAACCRFAGISFAGRPPFTNNAVHDPSIEQRAMARQYSRAKFLVAHSNLAAPAPYTHPTKEYLTGRWTDALSGGAVVAGVPPLGDLSARDLLWPGALLEFGSINLEENIEELRRAIKSWTPRISAMNHRMALRKLDWRWRFMMLADQLDICTPALGVEIARLKSAIDAAA